MFMFAEVANVVTVFIELNSHACKLEEIRCLKSLLRIMLPPGQQNQLDTFVTSVYVITR